MEIKVKSAQSCTLFSAVYYESVMYEEIKDRQQEKRLKCNIFNSIPYMVCILVII